MAKNPADYPFRVTKVTISGNAWSDQEIWTTGFFLGKPTADSDVPTAAHAAAVAGHWQTFFTTSTSRVSSVYRTTQVKLSQLELDGDVDLSRIIFHDYPSAIVGGNTGGPNPPQIALVATLLSARQRGLASKGRMYLPGINSAVTTATPKISTTDVTSIATNLQTMFNALRADPVLGDDPMLASKGRLTQNPIPGDPNFYVGGIIEPITALRVGDVLDTQRRRSNDIGEVFQSRTLT